MKLPIVSFEVAKELHRLGYNWGADCGYQVKHGKGVLIMDKPSEGDFVEVIYSAPTIALALKWFRVERCRMFDIRHTVGAVRPTYKFFIFHSRLIGEMNVIEDYFISSSYTSYDMVEEVLLEFLIQSCDDYDKRHANR